MLEAASRKLCFCHTEDGGQRVVGVKVELECKACLDHLDREQADCRDAMRQLRLYVHCCTFMRTPIAMGM